MDDGQRWPHDEILHAWWVEPGRLLAGEYPGATTSERAREKVRLLVDAGVDSIVDLTTPDDHLASYRDALEFVATQAGRQIHHFAHPIPDMGVIDHDGYDGILSRIRDEIRCGRVAYRHCWGGKGRTCTVVGCLLIDDGLNYEAGIARIARSCGWAPARPSTLVRSHLHSIECFGSAQLCAASRKGIDAQGHYLAIHHS